MGIALERLFYGGAGGRGETREKFLGKIWPGEDGKRLSCMVFNAFFPEDYGTPAGVPFPLMTVCLPVRMGTVSA